MPILLTAKQLEPYQFAGYLRPFTAFLAAVALASRLGLGFTIIRKKDKLPGDIIGHKYKLK